MSEGLKTQISRRSIRAFTEDIEALELGNMANVPGGSQCGSNYGDTEMENMSRLEARGTSTDRDDGYTGPLVDVGKDIRHLFPSNAAELKKSGMWRLFYLCY